MSDINEGPRNIRMKTYESRDGLFLAGCDEELVGRTFLEGGIRLKVEAEFYGEESVTEGVFASYLAEAMIGNLSGERVVKLAIRLGLVEAENVLFIQGVPHAQFVRM